MEVSGSYTKVELRGVVQEGGKKGVGEIVLMVKVVFPINFIKRYFCRILDLQSEV